MIGFGRRRRSFTYTISVQVDPETGHVSVNAEIDIPMEEGVDVVAVVRTFNGEVAERIKEAIASRKEVREVRT